ncbi:MAG: transketolase [Lewinellaceae bacterium]|nr:transketolase [Lewinellaceae bacterium]
MSEDIAFETRKRRTENRPLYNAETYLHDFEICCLSREASLLARREVLTGKAKFGITGDGKEVPQVALAHFLQPGDFRSGYYRDLTLMLALNLCTVEDFFAQLYADPDHDPFSGGRQMNSHFATPFIDSEGNWLPHVNQFNVSADISSTGGQMARSLGLALASKKYREAGVVSGFSNAGNEIVACTIGDASTTEGVFWETVNAAGVMQVPLAVFVWDDGYGISVAKEFQTTKGSISAALAGFEPDRRSSGGVRILKEKGWKYPELLRLFETGLAEVRQKHQPALFHIEELTQPQGHSTSGSHERYKSPDRLQWEKQTDCLEQMKGWLVREGYATEEKLHEIRTTARLKVKESRDKAWKRCNHYAGTRLKELEQIYAAISDQRPNAVELKKELSALKTPVISEVLKNARKMLFEISAGGSEPALPKLESWIRACYQTAERHYHAQLYSSSPNSALAVAPVGPVYGPNPERRNGYEILNRFFDHAFSTHSNLIAFGEDVGKIGDVNQGLAGIQQKYGESRIFDTGIREWTIVGQAIGLSMRGWRPIAEIQYLDYLVYGLSALTDDLATVRYRSNGKQMAPAIIRTRGHRLEGIWHSGSPMGMVLNALRGIYVITPRDMTRAAGFYNTLLHGDDPGIIIECLNGYRLKEPVPDNLEQLRLPLGVPDVLQEGSDVTLVTYGSSVRVALEGMELLKSRGISVELIDVQTLLPFDIHHRILESLKKTNRILFMDEDVPGGTTAYMMQQVLEVQGGYRWLDAPPVTLTARAHRPPYGSDGDYFSKPNSEDVVETVLRLVRQ